MSSPEYTIDIAGTVLSWGVDERNLLDNVLKGVALSPNGCVVVKRSPAYAERLREEDARILKAYREGRLVEVSQ